MKPKPYFRNLLFSTLLILSTLQIKAATARFNISSTFNASSLKTTNQVTNSNIATFGSVANLVNGSYDVTYVTITNNGSSTLTFSGFNLHDTRSNQGFTSSGTPQQTSTFGAAVSGTNNANLFNTSNRLRLNGSNYTSPNFPNAPQIEDEFTRGGFSSSIIGGLGRNVASFTLAAGQTRQIAIYSNNNVAGLENSTGGATVANYSNRFHNNPWKLDMIITGVDNPNIGITTGGGANNTVNTELIIVPEPTTALLLLLGTFAFFSRRTRAA